MTRPEHDAHNIIARAYCRGFLEICTCGNDPSRCHAGTLYLHEAARAVIDLKRLGLLNLESPRVPPGVMQAGEVVAHVPASPLPAEFHGKQPEAEAA